MTSTTIPHSAIRELSAAEYQSIHQRAATENRDLGELVQEFWSSKVVADIFEDEAATLQKKRDEIDLKVEKISAEEEALREKARSHYYAIEARDEIVVAIHAGKERLARLKGLLDGQIDFIGDMLAKPVRTDIDVIHSAEALLGLRELMVVGEAWLKKQAQLLEAAETKILKIAGK